MQNCKIRAKLERIINHAVVCGYGKNFHSKPNLYTESHWGRTEKLEQQRPRGNADNDICHTLGVADADDENDKRKLDAEHETSTSLPPKKSKVGVNKNAKTLNLL